ncbi:hypothetical protein [Glycocaulis sp.]|uniref:hypothetical protein n=1 Tax=Glycocaulis sp. TaxID=1969725 RepID=UPI0025BF77C9|nr:hypothetical protein [Glycocaulis sp.]MCH8522356.1 hypothetical protein [Glycocaulis sp.]
MSLDDEFIRSARRQGQSDGAFGYPSNPGDFEGPARVAYLAAYEEASNTNPGAPIRFLIAKLMPDTPNASQQSIIDQAESTLMLLEAKARTYYLVEQVYQDRVNTLLEALQAGEPAQFVHNAAVTTDIESLRRICLDYANWWNRTALPAIARAVTPEPANSGK